MTINKVFLAGRLVRDPEIKELNASLVVCKITLATDYSYASKDGLKQKESCFTECTLWNKQAELCAASLRKGSLVTVEGRLKMDKWTDKETGKERSKHTIAVDAIVFMQPKESMGGGEFNKLDPFQESDLPF